MESIKDKVAIIGMGCTKFGELWDKSVGDLLVDAAYEAFEDAGIGPQDIQAAWIGTVFSGLTSLTIRPLRLPNMPITRVENMCATGSEALRAAAYAIMAGACDIALAIGVEKLKDSGSTGLPGPGVVGANTLGTSGISAWYSPPAMFALMATRYFSHYKIDPDDGKRLLAKIAVKNHHNGSLSPKAHFHNEITEEQVMKVPIIAWPLGLYDCCGTSDGASAAILTRADMAKNFRDDPIYLKAAGLDTGSWEGAMRPDFDYRHDNQVINAGQRAYKDAGIKDPRKEISMAEIHDCFTINEMLLYEDLGFSPRGRAKEDILAGTFTMQGELPINTDGGLKCFGHPLGASGLRMMYEAYKQLQGKAGPRQVKNPRLGLTNNVGGTTGSTVCSVLIVGNEKG
jgi:acetyl-CoA C-acetyltransferase